MHPNLFEDCSTFNIPITIEQPSLDIPSFQEVYEIQSELFEKDSPETKSARNNQNSIRTINRFIKKVAQANNIKIHSNILFIFKQFMNKPQCTALLMRNFSFYERKIIIWGLKKNIHLATQQKIIERMTFLINHGEKMIADEEVEKFMKQFLDAGNEKKKNKCKITNQEYLLWQKSLLSK